MGTIKRFISKKFLAAILTPLLLMVNASLDNPLDQDSVSNIVLVIIAYLLGQSAVDAMEKIKGGK